MIIKEKCRKQEAARESESFAPTSKTSKKRKLEEKRLMTFQCLKNRWRLIYNIKDHGWK